MSNSENPLAFRELPIPPGFALQRPTANWRYEYADHQHHALSLRAIGGDLSGLAQLASNGLWKLVCHNRRIGDDDFDNVVRFDGLEELDVGGTDLTDRSAAAMHTFRRLRWLSFSRCHITDAAMEHIAGLRALEHLDISGTQVTDSGLRALAFHPKLRVLNIRDTVITGEALAPLVTLPELRQVWMTHHQHRHAHHFSDERPEVEILY